MIEILGHPWMTYTSFPKYIDYKLMKIQNLSTRQVKDTIDRVILDEVLEKPFNRNGLSKYDDLEKLVKDKDCNKSFVIGYALSHFENKKFNRNKRKEKKKVKEGFTFTFGLLESIFEYKESSEKFKKHFRNYTIDLFKNYERIPWRVGMNFCTNLKKLFNTFIRASNFEKIRVEIINANEFKFRCFFIDENGSDIDKTFLMQIFDSSDEYVLDFLNEKMCRIDFLLICFKLSRRMKV